MEHGVTVSSSSWLSRLSNRLGLRVIVIAVPLLLVTGLSFSYMQFQSVKLQQAMAAKKVSDSHSRTTNLPSLELVTQPILPTLDTGSTAPAPTDHSTNETTNDTAIGPASKNATKALQGVSGNDSSDKNSQIQATRKPVEFDELDL
ncbi:MAG: hypothetical protein QFB87_02580 [Patescibacteria group bacterium]|nr:hypothetical protein [Patescibacteria group bacterium]